MPSLFVTFLVPVCVLATPVPDNAEVVEPTRVGVLADTTVDQVAAIMSPTCRTTELYDACIRSAGTKKACMANGDFVTDKDTCKEPACYCV